MALYIPMSLQWSLVCHHINAIVRQVLYHRGYFMSLILSPRHVSFESRISDFFFINLPYLYIEPYIMVTFFKHTRLKLFKRQYPYILPKFLSLTFHYICFPKKSTPCLFILQFISIPSAKYFNMHINLYSIFVYRFLL